MTSSMKPVDQLYDALLPVALLNDAFKDNRGMPLMHSALSGSGLYNLITSPLICESAVGDEGKIILF